MGIGPSATRAHGEPAGPRSPAPTCPRTPNDVLQVRDCAAPPHNDADRLGSENRSRPVPSTARPPPRPRPGRPPQRRVTDASFPWYRPAAPPWSRGSGSAPNRQVSRPRKRILEPARAPQTQSGEISMARFAFQTLCSMFARQADRRQDLDSGLTACEAIRSVLISSGDTIRRC